MADHDEPETVVLATEDPFLRLECFKAVVGATSSEISLREALERADFLFNWAMNYEQTEEAPEDPRAITPEDKCDRRH